jgi:hypothetical protein
MQTFDKRNDKELTRQTNVKKFQRLDPEDRETEDFDDEQNDALDMAAKSCMFNFYGDSRTLFLQNKLDVYHKKNNNHSRVTSYYFKFPDILGGCTQNAFVAFKDKSPHMQMVDGYWLREKEDISIPNSRKKPVGSKRNPQPNKIKTEN